MNAQALHWVFKVSNLKTIGMKVLRHEEFGFGCEATCNGPYQRPWSKTMIGFGPESTHFVFELTYTFGIRNYPRGNDFRHVIINGRKEILERIEKGGYQTIEENGNYYLQFPLNEYRIKLVDIDGYSSVDPVVGISINVENLERSEEYYSNILKMTKFPSISASSSLFGYGDQQAKLELIQLGEIIDHKKGNGRIAFSIPDINIIYQSVQNSGDKILHHPVKLDTPGKATVEVVILQDRDDYEICFVCKEGFDSLSTTKEGDDNIDWEIRSEREADKL